MQDIIAYIEFYKNDSYKIHINMRQNKKNKIWLKYEW